MSVDLLDDLEAGELSVQFEGEEPEVVLEWAIERFSPSISISTLRMSLRVAHWSRRKPVIHASRPARWRCSGSTLRTWQQSSLFSTLL